jgi:ankyrin repeat protein
MIRLTLALFLSSASLVYASDEKPSAKASFEYDVVRSHELKPHRRTIRLNGVRAGFNQLHLTLTVSPAGDVIDVDVNGDKEALRFWPQLEDEVLQWKFTPFQQNGSPVTAEIEEYIDLVPSERLPNRHVIPPALEPNSEISISLQRSGCFGTCPSYTVMVTTSEIVFNGDFYVVAQGKHMAGVDAKKVRDLASRFVTADFYSMDDKYVASVTDNPTYVLSIDIDGHRKKVEDYVGEWEGMPAVISELEQQVDEFANTNVWIEGSEGLVQALQAEKFNFQSLEAQRMLKEAASRGQAETVRELVAAGVPLEALPVPRSSEQDQSAPSDTVGLLTSASRNFPALQILLGAGVSRSNQSDKDLALVGAAGSGNAESVRALIAYGADPNADLSKVTVVENGPGMTVEGSGAGSILIYAAESGNPEVVKEILRYHPNLEARNREGKTAIFAAGEYRDSDKEGARIECVRLLAQAGENVNARDKDGNTPLHEIFLTDVEEELLKLGADVNARNKDGETPIFTNVDNDSIALFIEHGADLSIRNNKGEDVVQAAKEQGPDREEALRKALEKLVKR